MVGESRPGIRAKGLKFLFNLCLVLLLYMGARAWFQRDLVRGIAPAIGHTDMVGEVVRLSGYQNEPVLLHFWATWCSVCAAERGVINAVNEDWNVISVAMQSGNAEQLNAFMQEHRLNWRTVNDSNGTLSGEYGVNAVPTSFVLKNRKIIFAQRGYITSVGIRLRMWAAKYWY